MTTGSAESSKLVFTALCPDCGKLRPIKGSGKCPECGVLLDVDAVATIRQAIRKRRQAYKVRLSRLAQRMHEVTDGPLEFKFRGVPYSQKSIHQRCLLPLKKR